jgi:tRNA (guanine26-N2/guanine27-N2)-dimethyltransferase
MTPAIATEENMTTIKEGSATMSFPANQESTVFYNPVQVQNRDLSTLMISLYAERRAIRKAVKKKRKDLNNLEEKLSKEETQKALEEYEKNIDVQELLRNKDGDGITVLDALAASGLRSIRYWNEVPGIKHVTINDLEEAAINRAKDNVEKNNLQDVMLDNNSNRDKGIYVNHGDATHEMYMSRRSKHILNPTPLQQKQQLMWDVIDLDPYGSAAPFLDGAVQAIENGGLLCITCTDMAALGGSHPETAYGRYASLPIQTAKYLQELALRILLHTISVSAAKYGRTIKPILSVGMAFYVRVFVEVNNDKRGVSNLSLNIGHVYQSTKCGSFITLPHGQMGGSRGTVYQSIRLNPHCCPETGAAFKVGGPMWLGALHDQNVIKTALERLSNEKGSSPNMELIATRKRIQGLLMSVSEEIDTPLYHTLQDLCRTLHCDTPPLKQFKAALFNAGYQVSGYHKDPTAIKTNAPNDVVWDIMREWVKRNPSKKTPAKDSPASKILSKETSIKVDFTIPEAMKGNDKISRFPQNPEKHWGPKRKASGAVKRKSDDTDNVDGQQKKK